MCGQALHTMPLLGSGVSHPLPLLHAIAPSLMHQVSTYPCGLRALFYSTRTGTFKSLNDFLGAIGMGQSQAQYGKK
jgi:hypothetical protein